MKKIIATLILAAAFCSGFAAKKGLKDHITETKLGSYDEFETGSGSLKTKKLTGAELNAQDFIVKFNPRKNTASLHYKKLGLKERLIFDADGRKAFIDAYKAYLADYDAKNLNRKKTKFENAYGQARMRVDWGAFTYNTKAHPKAEFGYIFAGKSPYFAIRVRSIKSEESHDGITPEYSGALLYFNRSQAGDLAEALSEETISNGMASIVNEVANDDDYTEDGAGYGEHSSKNEERTADYAEE
ncbi:hypothetical protein [Treponema sp.]|uniref:hypothetical protein n=1 Tax=Treponema sp. TaxID=166 RepID=UPI00298DCCFB|nr:hypothetical protein [Treponema sp.]MCQ2242295.1 hypothetical protein [Treponema sp.]